MLSRTPIENEIPSFQNPEELRHVLTSYGCRRCSLGFQPEINGCCVYRGNPSSRRMIIGEAPGKDEDSSRLPFTGPAGQLLDKIFASVGFDTNRDFYITNVVHCRPFSPKGSGKENYTPKKDQIKQCRPYLDQEIRLVDPKLIVLCGGVALQSILGNTLKITQVRGSVVEKDNRVYFPILHPAAILHAQPNKELHDLYRQQTWEDIQALKQLIEERNL